MLAISSGIEAAEYPFDVNDGRCIYRVAERNCLGNLSTGKAPYRNSLLRREPATDYSCNMSCVIRAFGIESGQTSPLIARRMRAASLAEMSKPESVRRPRTRRDDGLSRTPRGLRMALNLYPPL